MKGESRLTPEAIRVVSNTLSAPVVVPRALIHVLEAIPAAFVCLSIAAFGVVSAWMAPHSARVWYDPSLQYMISSLGWFRGEGYAYVDHPGTPVEVLGTLLLGLSYPVLSVANEEFVSHYLNHPQQFLSIAQSLIVGASVVVAFLVARRSIVITHWSHGFIGGGIAVLFFIVLRYGEYVVPEQGIRLWDGFRALSLWSHESFCFPAGTLLSMASLIAVRGAAVPSWRTVLGLGLASGVLTSVQLYFAAWVVGTAVALGLASRLGGVKWLEATWRALAVCVTAGVGFVLATLPIHDRYPQFASWIWSILSHQGIYGAGELGAPSPELLASNLFTLVLGAQALFVACGAGTIFLGWRLWRTRNQRAAHAAVWAAGIGLVVQIVVLLLLVAKHPHQRYLLPVAATLPLMFAAALDQLDVWPKTAQQLLAAAGLAAVLLFGRDVVLAMRLYAAETDWLRRADAATENMLAYLAAQRHVPRESLRTLWSYGTNSPCFGLWLGDEYVDRAFHGDIAQICPHDGMVYPLTSKVATSAGPIELAEYQDWDVTVLIDGWYGDMVPVARPPASTSYSSSIDAIRGLGKLGFITREVEPPSTGSVGWPGR